MCPSSLPLLHFVGLSEASDELKAVNSQKNELEEIIRTMENGQYKELKEKKRLLEKNIDALKSAFSLNQQQINEKISQHEKIIGANEQRRAQLEDMLQGYVAGEKLEKQVQDMLQHSSGASVKTLVVSYTADAIRLAAKRFQIS